MISLQDIPNDIKSVYFIKTNNYIKIGIASQLRTRFKAISTDCPTKCTLLGYIPSENHREIEKDLHKAYKEFHFRGEWYNYNKAIVKQIPMKYKNFVSLSKEMPICDEVFKAELEKANVIAAKMRSNWEVIDCRNIY